MACLSRTGLYTLPFLPGPFERPIGTAHRANESVDRSVLQRRAEQRNPAYEPANLLKYLQAQGSQPGGG